MMADDWIRASRNQLMKQVSGTVQAVRPNTIARPRRERLIAIRAGS